MNPEKDESDDIKYLISDAKLASYREKEPYFFFETTNAFNSSTEATTQLQSLEEQDANKVINAETFVRELNRIARMSALEGDYTDVDCSLVKVSAKEVLYDTEMGTLYAAVTAVPASDDVMFVPGDADSGDNVCGNYGENLNTDTRTFPEAAKEDGKRLIRVYAYPKEFEEEGSYAMDHLQLADSTPLLISFCDGALNDTGIQLNFTIQLYEVDPETGSQSLVNTYDVPVTATVKE